ncbi:GNAT family N-acetyltransferase [Dyella subtropica]|uniref:GNAT family N-acetyltransferase n=1 Tax=Dyella subtropica TaxID=2992127 RepID=UPI002252A38B|nr:GNAT family N-acetyltransferase [Dyella subtropica]
MTADLRLRLARLEDARAIGVLVRRVVRRWVLPDQPARAAAPLLKQMSARAIREKMCAGERFHLAFVNGVLAGVAAMRNDSHLFQFYIGTRYQGRGMARLLWRRAMHDSMRRAGTTRFTLNATVRAIPVYLRLGFVITDAEFTSTKGVVSTPMCFAVKGSPRRHTRA